MKNDLIFPFSDSLYNTEIKKPVFPTIGEKYRDCSILIELDNNFVREYDGEHGMDESGTWESISKFNKETNSFSCYKKSNNLTKLLKNEFSFHIKNVYIANL